MIRDPEFILNFLSALYIADLVTGADSVNDSKLFLTKAQHRIHDASCNLVQSNYNY